MPVLSVLFIVEVFTPFDQIVNLHIEIFSLEFQQILIIKWIVIQFLKLLRHLIVDVNVCVFAILLLDKLSIFGISVQLP